MKRFLALWVLLILAVSMIGAPALALQDSSVSFIPAAKGAVRMQGASVQAKHNYESADDRTIDLNKHDLTLNKGKTATLKATAGGKAIKVTWKSSNPKIAKVSASGKITAIAPGIAVITATAKNYVVYDDGTGSSNECYVTVQGSSKDPKPVGTNDRIYYYGKTKFKAPAMSDNYNKALSNVKKSIGGYSYTEDEEYGGYYEGLIFGSKVVSKAHTDIYAYFNEKGSKVGFGLVATGKSPIKTYRGITIGAKKSAVQQKYGLPTFSSQYKANGKTYEIYVYESHSINSRRGQYTRIYFEFLKSKGTVTKIICYCGGRYM